MKTLLLSAIASLTLIGTAQAQTFTVSGSSLRDANGNDFVMRGVNIPLAWFQTDVYNNLAAIHTNSGSNAVRIVWSTTAGADSVLQNTIQRAIDNKMIPMVELHDATGSNDPAALNNMAKWYAARASYFKQANIAKYVLINIANEWSDWYMANPGGPEVTVWRDAYKTAITTIRNAGITSTLVVDGAAYAQDIRASLLTYGQELLNYDPRHNLLFGVHMYCEWTSASKVESDLQAMKSANLPVVIGEFGNNHPPCGDIPYKDIMRIAQSKGIGYLAWSWKGNTTGTLDQLDLSSNWSGTTLKSWGNDVINGSNGIRATAKVASVFSGSTSSASSSKASSSVASSSSSSSKASSSSSSASGGTPPLSGTGDYPTGFSKCADEGGTCSVSKGTGWVAYGRKGKWVAKNVGVGKSIACTAAAFGSDPGGNPNKCSTQN
jgi:mannan endo-1,4-beta-mannosidase